MYSKRVRVDMRIAESQSLIFLCVCVCVDGVCLSSSHQQQSNCLLALFHAPSSPNSHKALVLFVILSFFFRGAAELVLLLVHCHTELRADLSFIASLAFISLRCLFNSSDYSVVTHVIKQANIQNSFSDNVVGGWEEAITAEYLEKVIIKHASRCTLFLPLPPLKAPLKCVSKHMLHNQWPFAAS